MSRDSSPGFTLIEVMVALAISGIVLLGARALLTQLADHTDRIVQAASEADREANADRLLRALVGRIDASTGEARTFSGDERAARFTTWCDVPAGWQEQCGVRLEIIPIENSQALTVHFSGGEAIVLRKGFRLGALRYLSNPGGGGIWLRSWKSTIATPLALGIFLDSDTMIVRIGERG